MKAPRGQGLLAALLLLALAAGCGSLDRAGPSSVGLPGGTWTATEVAGRAPDPASPPQLQFTADGRVAGSTGCNDFGGKVRLSGESIDISELQQTEIACPGEVGAIEAAFVRALGEAQRIGVEGDRLTLEGPAGSVVFGRG